MSVAVCEAQALDQCLYEGNQDLARRFFARAKPVINAAWAIVMGEDLRYPSVEGRRPFGFGWIGRYMDRVQYAASVDPVVLKCFFSVASFLAPPSALLAPSIVARVAAAGLGSRSTVPDQKVFNDAAPSRVFAQ
jgi:hypothetical protein